jgi:hypothetical protein
MIIIFLCASCSYIKKPHTIHAICHVPLYGLSVSAVQMHMKESRAESVSLFLSRCETEREESISQPSDTLRAYIHTYINITLHAEIKIPASSDIKVPSSGGGGNKTHTRFHYANNSKQQRHERERDRSICIQISGQPARATCAFFHLKYI